MCFTCTIATTGGAGGKGTWGKLTDMYDEDGHTHDSNDPNYDSIEEEVCHFSYLLLLSIMAH